MRRAILLVLLLPLPALGDWSGGVDANDTASYSFLTHFHRTPRGANEIVWWQTASYLSYRAREGASTERVSSPGLAAGGMYRWNIRSVTTGVGAGYEVRWTERRSDEGTKRSTDHGPTVNGDLTYRFSPLTATVVGGRYSHANRWRYVSADVRRELAPFLRAGPQVVWQGNRDLTVIDYGAFAQFPFGGTALHVRGGQSRISHRDGSRESRPYLSVGLATSFSF